MKAQNGFTLIELMIVILIVGILVGIAVPVFIAARDNSEKKVCMANLRTLRSAVSSYEAQSGETISDMSDLIPDFLVEEPVCPSVGDSSAYVIVSNPGEPTRFDCIFHDFIP